MSGRATGYPLEALEALRRTIRERRELELGEALRALEAAEHELSRRRVTQEQAARHLEEERRRLSPERAATAAELVRHRRYLERLALVLEEQARSCLEAEAERGRRDAICSGARSALARSQAELEALERHHAGWDRARRELEARRAEQELEELTAARRR